MSREPRRQPARQQTKIKSPSVNKSAGKSAPAPGSLVPAKNGGMIRHGSLPGNTPGTGRPPNQLREAMRGRLDEMLPDLWDRYRSGLIDALEFANFLARYGLGTKDELDITSHPAVQAFMNAVVDVLRRRLHPTAAEETMEEIRRALGGGGHG